MSLMLHLPFYTSTNILLSQTNDVPYASNLTYWNPKSVAELEPTTIKGMKKRATDVFTTHYILYFISVSIFLGEQNRKEHSMLMGQMLHRHTIAVCSPSVNVRIAIMMRLLCL